MYSSKKGQTIIEVMIALGLLTMGLLGLLDLLSQSFFLDRVISDQTKATYLAEEGVELAKSLIDNDSYLTAAPGSGGQPGWGACFGLSKGHSEQIELDYTSLPISPYTSTYSCNDASIKPFIGGGDPLYFNPVTNLYSYAPVGNSTNFTRDIIVTAIENYELGVQSIVSWSTGPITNQTINLQDDFYNWYPGAGGGSGGGGGGGGAPTVTLFTNTSTITIGTSPTLNWVTSGAPTTCSPSSIPSEADWNTLNPNPGGGFAQVTPQNVGPQQYTIQCSNASGTSPASFVTINVQGGGSQNVNLKVADGGTGTGTVSGTGGISCGTDCNASLASGTLVTLTESPDPGSAFGGWSGGGCSGTGGCSFTITQDTTVNATFDATSSITGVAMGCQPDTVQVGNTSTCTATVSGTGNFSQAVAWSLNPAAPGGGTITGSGSSVIYTAPGTAQTVDVHVVSQQDASQSSTVSVDVTSGAPPQQFTFSLSLGGGGTGSVTSSPAGISCEASCTAQFSAGPVTLTATPGSASTFSGWAGVCSGQGTCSFTISANSSATSSFTLKDWPSGGYQPALFGMHSNHYVKDGPDDETFPPLSFNSFRLWGSMTTWGDVNSASGTYNFGDIDKYLSGLYKGGVQEVGITLAPELPSFANKGVDPGYDCNPPDKSHVCVHPSDLNDDGTGVNAYWDNYVVALAEHVYGQAGNPNYLSSHATITWWEPWNEWARDYTINPTSTQGHFIGALSETDMSYAQMVRMTQDLRCILKGTPATSSLWAAGETCTAAQGGTTNLLASLGVQQGGIDPSALILTPSTDGVSVDKNAPSVMQNFLYCKNAPKAAPYYCTTGDQGSQAVDVINNHFYSPVPENIKGDANDFSSLLEGVDQGKPFWDDEGSWGPDGQATVDDTAYVARYYLIGADSGAADSFSEMYWYSGDLCGDPTDDGSIACPTGGGNWNVLAAGVAYDQIEQWMVGAKPVSACANNGGIWTCDFTRPGGYRAEAIWDTNTTCDTNSCPYSHTYTDPSGQYLRYKDLTGAIVAIPQGGPNKNQVMIGGKPILMENISD